MRQTPLLVLTLALTVLPHPAGAATRSEVLSTAARVADRLAAIKPLGRSWEDAPYLVGSLLLAEQMERDSPGSGARFVERAASAVDRGDAHLSFGDDAGYAQAALDLYRLTAPGDALRRAERLRATDGPTAFARRAVRTRPSDGPPEDPWWAAGGYGARFWVDDLFTLPPWLAMRGSTRDGLPGDPIARDLAYEWIEAYLYDHRPASADAREASVPSARERAGPLLWDPDLALFRHDLSPGGLTAYWGRGNGWAAFGLVRAARFLDAPYGGARYAEIVDRTGLRELLSRLAASLAARRTSDGGWPTDLVHQGACSTAETSGTALITFMLATGVNEGWLDRSVYAPIVLQAYTLLLGRIDADGDVVGIQPPGTGPDCRTTTSDDPHVNVTYGVGAVLLAAAEAARLGEDELARLSEEAAKPIEKRPLGWTWLLASGAPSPLHSVAIANRGLEPVHAVVTRDESQEPSRAVPVAVDLPPRGTALIPLAGAASSAELLTVRATGELVVSGRVVDAARERRGSRDRSALRRRNVPAAPLFTALSDGESADAAVGEGDVALGAANPTGTDARMTVRISASDGSFVQTFEIAVPAGSAAFEAVSLPSGAIVTFRCTTRGSSVVPLAVPAER